MDSHQVETSELNLSIETAVEPDRQAEVRLESHQRRYVFRDESRGISDENERDHARWGAKRIRQQDAKTEVDRAAGVEVQGLV